MSSLQLPEGLLRREAAYSTHLLNAHYLDLRKGSDNLRFLVNEAIKGALRRVHDTETLGQALIKVHIGEPKCMTRLRPDFVTGSVEFLRMQGATGVVAGDTTVAYSGPRGHAQNPVDDVSVYLNLAKAHGWHADGDACLPFVVLDRPVSAVNGPFGFEREEERVELDGVNRFSDFHLAGGFAAADFVVNHAHLTLHGLAGLAGCVKSIAMGCAALPGKLRMHQSLLPHFDSERCGGCGKCVEHCPEDALELDEGADSPVVDPDACIGCGECEAVCASNKAAVSLTGEKITNWTRGEHTLPQRMVDYAVGLMNGRWDSTIHVLHMYTITERCDCLDQQQKPMLERDLGFLIGKNPFAVDLAAARMLDDALQKQGVKTDTKFLEAAEAAVAYAHGAYGILSDTSIESTTI